MGRSNEVEEGVLVWQRLEERILVKRRARQLQWSLAMITGTVGLFVLVLVTLEHEVLGWLLIGAQVLLVAAGMRFFWNAEVTSEELRVLRRRNRRVLRVMREADE